MQLFYILVMDNVNSFDAETIRSEFPMLVAGESTRWTTFTASTTAPSSAEYTA